MFSDFHRAHEHLAAAVEGRLVADCGLALSRVEVLDVIAQLGTCRVNDIAEELGITWGGTSKIVDRLEAAQLCKRRPNPHDGRSSLIELTPMGSRSLTKALKVMTSELADTVGSVLEESALHQFSTSCRSLRQSTRGQTIADLTA